MAAGSTTALFGYRRARWGRSRYAVVSAIVVAVALAVVTSMVARELVSIQSLASEVQSQVLPQIMARQQRAIWTESLRSAADVVVFAPDRITRHQALAKAAQLAANVTHADIASREALDDAWASIRLASGKADEAHRIEQQMQAMLSEADSLITDMSANLSSIVDDSGATIARMIKETLNAQDRSPFSRQLLEEALAINTTSHELVASLDRGRIILTSALSLASDEELDSAEAHFVAIGNQLQARVDTLRGNSDYEYLPEMIERFRRLEAVFGHQRTKLVLRQEAIAASASAKLRLGVVRETLAADAAGAADASVANIAASASRIKFTAAAIVVILIAAVAVLLKRSWQNGRAEGKAEQTLRSPQDPALARAPPEETVRATVASLERLIKAEGNLEYWRQNLVVKLTAAVGGALRRAAEGVSDPGDRASDKPASGGADAADPVLPAEFGAPLGRVVGLIERVAAQTSLSGLEASLDGVRLLGVETQNFGLPEAAEGETADPQSSPADALAAAAAAADAATERVGLAISQINAVAPQADQDPTQVKAELVQAIARLGDHLAAIRDGNELRHGYVG